MPFEPGRSGNPSGRPRGAAGLARYIREQTDDFHRLVDLTIEIACDPTTRKADRINALAILFDRGLGKPHASSSVAVTASAVALPAGWDSMTNGERLAWADHLRQRALAGATVGLLDDGSDE